MSKRHDSQPLEEWARSAVVFFHLDGIYPDRSLVADFPAISWYAIPLLIMTVLGMMGPEPEPQAEHRLAPAGSAVGS